MRWMRPSGEGRRAFLIAIANGLSGLSLLALGRGLLSYLRPGAPIAAPSRVVLGSREGVAAGTVLVSHEAKVILVGTPSGMYALSALCPHLGCMTSYRADTRVIECACHGSAFALDGTPLHGPSGPLHWLDVQVDARNRVVVDTARIVDAGHMYKGPA